eukprot:scaffold317015_cov52-Prasinocladus_malaysianus.AAC.1
MAELLQLLMCIGEGYRLLAMYQCREAINAFQKLSPSQYNTAWVLCQVLSCSKLGESHQRRDDHVARAQYEQVDYPAAARTYEEARRRDPCCLEGMEVYSTVLWHMKREVELSYLAHETIAMDRLSPQAI